jgi:ABC-type Mn2+/Zn2+ transport system permease subunit
MSAVAFVAPPASLWDDYLSVLGKAFFQHAMLAVVLIGALCGIVGTYVVLRGFAFIGDALAHATFPGVAVAYLLGTSILGGALVAGLVTSALIGFLSRHRRVSNDTAIGVLFAGAFALGVMILSRLRTYRRDLSSLLFGNILGVTRADLLLIVAIGALVLLAIVVFYRELLLAAFDPLYAASLGYRVGLLDLLTLALLTLTIVVGLQAVGNVLIVALIVTPSAAARLLTDRVPAMMALGALIGAGSGLAGLFASYPTNLAPGATIVLVATLVFFLALLFSPRQGFVTVRLLGRRRPGRATAPIERRATEG